MSKEKIKRPDQLIEGAPVSTQKTTLPFGQVFSVSEYSMLDECLQLGGVYRGEACARAGDEHAQPTAGDMTTRIYSDHVSRVLARAATARSGGGTGTTQKREAFERGSLSTAHISPEVNKKLPNIEYYEGASIFKASPGGTGEQIGGGVRGQIDGFSYASRRRLMQTIGKVRRDADLPAFVTLTYPFDFPEDPKVVKRDLDNFFKRLRRKFKNEAGAIWKMEPQERGAAHFHLMIWGADLQELKAWVPAAWFEVAGQGDTKHFFWHMGMLGNGNEHCVQQVRSFAGVWSYAAKYLGKSFLIAGWGAVGRFWGVFNRGKIPFGEKVVLEVSKAKTTVVLRYMRRFMRVSRSAGRLKKRITVRKGGLSMFCDASQWAIRLL